MFEHLNEKNPVEEKVPNIVGKAYSEISILIQQSERIKLTNSKHKININGNKINNNEQKNAKLQIICFKNVRHFHSVGKIYRKDI